MKSRKKVNNYEKAKELFQQNPGVSFRELAKKSGIPTSSLQRYHEDWLKEQAENRDSNEPKQQKPDPWQGLQETTEKGEKDNSAPFIGADDQVKKPPPSDRSPLAQRVLAEMGENQKETA